MGDVVLVLRRKQACVNEDGGVGRISNVTPRSSGVLYEVTYVLDNRVETDLTADVTSLTIAL